MHIPDLISGVYNYCDRWCERCPFTNQCSIFDPDDQEHCDPSPELFDLLDDQFPISWQHIKPHLSSTNFSTWESKIPQTLQLDAFTRELANKLQLSTLSRNYSQKGHEWLKGFHKQANKSAIQEPFLIPDSELPHSSKEDTILQPSTAHEVIQWYLFFISAKTERAIGGLKDLIILEVLGDQNDANGSAKIALLAIERSLVAWEVLLQEQQLKPAVFRTIILPLAQLRVGLKSIFPSLHKFIRPGFDEMGAHSSDY